MVEALANQKQNPCVKVPYLKVAVCLNQVVSKKLKAVDIAGEKKKLLRVSLLLFTE